MMQLSKRVESTRISEKEYRSIRDRLSYSSIKLYDENREAFYHEHVLGDKKRDNKSKATTLGSVVHHMLSGQGEEEFDRKFHVAINKVPGGQMGDLCENLITRSLQSVMDQGDGQLVQTDSFSVIFGDAFMSVKYNYAGEEIAFKKKDVDTVLALFQKDGEAYYKEVMENSGKEIVSVYTIENAERIVQKVKEHQYTAWYANVQTGTEENVEVFNELPILFTISGVEYKALIDKVIVNYNTQTIKPIDWKTSWDNENPDMSYTKYGYYIQAAIYDYALKFWQADNELHNFAVEPMDFIYIDTTGFNDPVVHTLSQDDIDRAKRGFRLFSRRYKGTDELMEEIAWNVSTAIWTTVKQLYENNGRMKLTLPYGSRN